MGFDKKKIMSYITFGNEKHHAEKSLIIIEIPSVKSIAYTLFEET
jgi:hypothetical protein